MIKKSGSHLWILTEFLSWIEKQDGQGWPDSPDRLRLAPDVKDYCELTLEEIEQSAGEGWDDLEVFLITLAILDDRPWLIEDLVVLSGLTLDGRKLRRLRGLITDHASRIVTHKSSLNRIQFRDSYFRDYLREPNGRDALEVARRLVGLVGQRPDADRSEDLIRYAIERSAWHVINDGERDTEFAAKLVFDTNWAPERLASLSRDPFPGDSFLEELVLLRAAPLTTDRLT